MGVIDRTDEFRQVVAHLSAKQGGAPQALAVQQQMNAQQSQLNAQSSLIASEIDKTSVKVQELRKMARSRAIFNDKTSEIEDLTMRVKADIIKLNEAMDAIESSTKGAGLNKSCQDHSSNIVKTLRSRLLEVMKGFQSAQEDRTKAMSQQDRRRKMYAVGDSAASNPFAQRANRPSGNAADLEGGGQGQAQEVHSSRANAVENVQRTIEELATMFKKMAVMVTAQEEMIQRIDHDVDDTKSNVDQAQDNLLKYFHHISSNRGLIIKVFLILIFFVVFFVVFLA